MRNASFTWFCGLTALLALSMLPQAACAQGGAAPPPADPPPREPLVSPLALDSGFEAPPAEPDAREARYGRAGIELGGILGLGAIWYWVNKEVNSADWEYSNFSDRLTVDALRFDNNSFATNHLLHTGAGAIYHTFSRANGLPLWSATLFTVGTSTLWEGVLEFKEKVSLNDEITTSVGGVAVGEALFQVGEYLTSAPGGGNVWHQAAAWTLSFPVALHNTIDGRKAPDGPTDNLGLSTRFWHRFEIDLESTRLTNNRARLIREQGLRLSAVIVNMRGYMEPRRMRRTFTEGNFTELRVRLAREGSTVGEFDVAADVICLGVHYQDLQGEVDDVFGPMATMGLSLGFEHLQRRGLGPHDRIAIVHLPGGILDFRQGLGGRRWLRVRGSAHFGFAAMHALAWEAWHAQHPETRTKSVLEDQDYAYYAGLTMGFLTAFTWGGLELGALGRYGLYESIEGLDRHQEVIEVDLETEEKLMEHHFWIGWNFSEPAIQVRLSMENLVRGGRAEEIETTASDTRGIGAIGYVF